MQQEMNGHLQIAYLLFSMMFQIKMYVLLLLPITILCCVNSEFFHSSCKFQIQSEGPLCSDNAFVKCQFTACLTQTTDPVTNLTICGQYGTYQSNHWENCRDKCCQTTGTHYQSCLDTLQQKRSGREEGLTAFFVFLVILVVIGGILFIIFLIFVISLLQDIYTSRQWRRQRQDNVHHQYQQEKIHEQDKKQSMEHSIQLEEVFGDSSSKAKLQQTSCSVCLDLRCNVKLHCGHMFHRTCILECLQKNSACILCRKDCREKVSQYCEICLERYRERYFRNPSKDILDDLFVCNQCQT